VISPPAKREAVRVAREEARLSERRACGLLQMHRGSCRYRRRERKDTVLRTRLQEIAGRRPCFGCRRVHQMLRREQENGISKAVEWTGMKSVPVQDRTGKGDRREV
jgi:putative transposase